VRLDKEPAPSTGPAAAPADDGVPAHDVRRPKLVVDHVWKSFGDHVVLGDVSLSVAEHEVICLIGASGSGKSTLLRCVDLLEHVDDGAILLDGVDISAPGLDADRIRRRLGIVFQSYNLFPHRTVLQNVTLAPRRVLGQRRASAEDHAVALLDRFGLADKRHEYPDRLSGGQQQRVAIVRALAMDPELMLLDEITSALDPELVGEVLTVVRELKAAGMTMLIATHEMGFAREIADRVCFLDRGTIVEAATPEVIFTDPTHPRTRRFLQRIIAAGRL
jgi:polar amino acid transport system ATP-binding protein